MKRILPIAFLLFTASFLLGQVVADFENFELEVGEFINNDESGQGFASGIVSLPNNFNENYESWDGWAVSATNDVTTPGFTNQYSAITGSGFDGSVSYGVAFSFADNFIRLSDSNNGPFSGVVNGLYITNSTYAYLSMLDGDAFAKKFGGETGDDPDFFSVVFRGHSDGVMSTDSVEFFLGDYRATDAADDFLVDEWTWVDLSGLGEVDSLSFSMRSSDVGEFGINTPLYFCVDDITVSNTPVSSTNVIALEVDVYPTLANENFTIDLKSGEKAVARLVSIDGQLIFDQPFIGGQKTFDVKNVQSGFYVLQVEQDGKINTQKIVIQ